MSDDLNKYARVELIKSIPENAISVKVLDERGRKLFRVPSELVDSDKIITRSDGTPIVMTSAPGRPKQLEEKETLVKPANPIVKALAEKRVKEVQEDHILKSLRSGGSLDKEMFSHIAEGLAEEAANLKFDRDDSHRTGDDSVQISMKRANVLKLLSDTLFQLQKVEVGEIDFDSPPFKALFEYLVDTFKEAMESTGIRSESVDTTFQQLSRSIDDSWKDEAKRRMRLAK